MKLYKLKNLFRFEPKSQYKAGDGLEYGSYPFYTSSSVLNKRINIATFEAGSLVFGTGGTASIHFATEEFSTSSHCIVAVCKVSELNPKFVFYYLQGNLQILEQGFKGAGLKNISSKYIQDIEVPICSYENQNKIVAILDKASMLIQQRKDSIDLLDSLLKAQFLDMFGDPIINQRNWKVSPLQEVGSLNRGRFSARPRNDPSYFNGDYPFIQTGDINNSRYRLVEYTQTLNEKGVSVSREFKAGTIVIAIVGATIGATAILMIDTFATDSVIGIEVNSQTNNIFLEMLLRFYRQVLKDKAPEGDKPNINLKILNPLVIIQPPLELQQKYAFISEKIEKQRAKMSIGYEQQKELFSSIIQRAYNGQLNFDVSVELDALLETIGKNGYNNDFSLVTKDLTYLSNLVDRLNERSFKNNVLYESAKMVAFKLLKDNQFVTQEYDERLKKLRLVLK